MISWIVAVPLPGLHGRSAVQSVVSASPVIRVISLLYSAELILVPSYRRAKLFGHGGYRIKSLEADTGEEKPGAKDKVNNSPFGL